MIWAVIGAAAAWLLEVAQIASSQPALVPPVTLAVALAVIGGLDIALALPIRRAVRARERGRIDPFYATRVALIAKASSISGSLIAGAGAGILVFLLSRSVVAGVGSIVMATATIVGSVILLAGGLIAERLCSNPPDDDESKREPNPAAVRPH
jgi:hypothetical protein